MKPATKYSIGIIAIFVVLAGAVLYFTITTYTAAEAKAMAEKAAAERARAEKAAAEARAMVEKGAAERAATENAARTYVPLVERDLGDSSTARAQAAAPDAMFAHAAGLERTGEGAQAVKMYTRAARSGSGKAAKRLGEIYAKGIAGVPRDDGESRKWYNAARVLGEDIPQAARR